MAFALGLVLLVAILAVLGILALVAEYLPLLMQRRSWRLTTKLLAAAGIIAAVLVAILLMDVVGR